jgi:kynureninase
MQALSVALDQFDGVDLVALRAHSLALTDRCIARADALGLDVVTPREADQRGSQVSLRHPRAWEVVQAAIEARVIGDFRPPDLIRLGFAPLHLTLADVDEAMSRLADILASGAWQRWQDAPRPTVT